ncbi:fumarylacetoacetate hydrolase family protein [Pseudooceanicola sp. CBS1P-1]|uniref:Fumarylacetoacetate hydrolase n=1 Tax=Pseudooceanicola albus TaxID=2692189 RepID=A0A6L7GBK5_9RHOB|nr:MULTISPECIES: fumarylacetoacetate hydrolase family protein [Pseudooceanicola]MBT9386795.1 fumarylacetoacetate hydrolase family protein [Pseudooceanicola endophyticus]MXN20947.1 fumarylacetoacetate hydrolase [Pseudooceanicola albus]
MRFATLPDGSPDGRLHLVSRDNTRCIPAQAAPTLQAALEGWDALSPALQAEYAALNQGGGQPFDPAAALAPLPRAWQWLDGSAFESHGDLMDAVFGFEKKEKTGRPLMYQGVSDRFLAPSAPARMPSEADGIDFEGEFGVICKATPMGVNGSAADHIALVVQINDWSLRKLAPVEMKTGFGWIQAKPPCSMAPVAVTPDELGAAWRDARVDLPLNVEWNGAAFGAPNGYHMAFGFDDLVRHAAYSRDLVPGTVIGSGTVSNSTFRQIGSACIAERRGIETLDEGAARTPFMSFGDEVRMECRAADGSALFGAIRQTVVAA